MMPRSTSIAYIDVLTCLFAFFVLFFVLSEDAVEKTKGNIVDPSNFLIEMTWTDSSPDDVDLWIENPAGYIVMYSGREIGGMTLDTDNTGSNSYVKDAKGEMIPIVARREVGSIRKVIAGRYTINVMMYNKRLTEPTKVKVRVRKLNPYSDIYETEVELSQAREEKTIIVLDLDDEGRIISRDTTEQISLLSRLRK